MNIAPRGNTIDGLAAATITARQALKITESGVNVLLTPCTADTDRCVGFALNDANEGEVVLVQVDGPVEFIANAALDASSDAGKFLTCAAAGEMAVAGAAKLHWLQWIPHARTMRVSNGDVAENQVGLGIIARGTTAA